MIPRTRASLLPAVLALLIVVGGMSPPPARGAAAPDTLSIAEFLEIPVLASPVVSPDGRRVAYLWTRRDLAADERITQLWLVEVATGATQRLSFGEHRPRAIAWRPGGGISYLRPVADDAQVWWNPLDGSEPRPVTELQGGVGAYWWAPDGSRLAVLAPPDAAGDTAEVAADDERADWTVWDRLEQPDQYHQLWIVGVSDAGPDTTVTPRRLTEPPSHPYHVAWAPDGATLALTYNRRFSSLVDEEQLIALVDVASGSVTPITPTGRHSSFAVFSPDGARLAYFTDRRADLRAYLNLKDLVVRDLDAGRTEVLTQDTAITLGGRGSIPDEAPIWSRDGDALYLRGADGTALDLYRVTLADRRLRRVTDADGNVGDWSLAGGTLAYLVSALHRPGSLMAGPVAGERRALVSTDDTVAAFDLEPPRKLRLPGYEGITVEGFLFLPPGAGENDRLPAVIEMHGGPYSRYGDAWTTRYPWHVLAHAGFAVFIANPRGGTGYGEEFLRGVYRNFGTDDYRDLMAAVDALIERGTVDPAHLGFTGYSYGGLMTNVVISRTDRFRAAVSIAGIFDYVSAMGQNNPQLFIDSYRRPWDEDLPRMWEQSPASRAGSITTPTLVMHGTEDEPVDPRQSIELFSYLQLNGVPSRLVLYPDEGHGIDRPSHMLDYQTRELAWFRHYLLDDAEAAGAETPEPVEP